LLDGLVRYRFGDNAELMGAWASARNVEEPFRSKAEPPAGSVTPAIIKPRCARGAGAGKGKARWVNGHPPPPLSLRNTSCIVASGLRWQPHHRENKNGGRPVFRNVRT